MKTMRVLTATMAVALSLATIAPMWAAPVQIKVPVQAKFGKSKLVSFHLRNDGSTTILLKSGKAEMSLEPGKTLDVQLSVGEQIIAESNSASFHKGDVVAVVDPVLTNATMILK